VPGPIFRRRRRRCCGEPDQARHPLVEKPRDIVPSHPGPPRSFVGKLPEQRAGALVDEKLDRGNLDTGCCNGVVVDRERAVCPYLFRSPLRPTTSLPMNWRTGDRSGGRRIQYIDRHVTNSEGSSRSPQGAWKGFPRRVQLTHGSTSTMALTPPRSAAALEASRGG
jgi:hypothetical protein